MPELIYIRRPKQDFPFRCCLNKFVFACQGLCWSLCRQHHRDAGRLSLLPRELIRIGVEERAADRSGQTAHMSCIVMLSAPSLCLFGLAACHFVRVDGS